MRIITRAHLLIFAFISLALTWTNQAGAAESSKGNRPNIYDESADGSKQITAALAQAKASNKHVLLQFGANWCPWCHKLHELFASNKAIADNLKGNYVVALIDVNKNHNKDMVTKYQGERLGIPFIVILDENGKHLTTKNTGELEEGDHHSPEKVLGFLKSWAPKS